jgi:hypothetical protein
MSAQGGTLARRGTIRMPFWPVAGLVAGLIVVSMATLVGQGILQDRSETAPVASIEQVGRRLVVDGRAPVLEGTAPVLGSGVLESATAAVREQGAGLPFHEAGRAHEVLGGQASGITYMTGLEYPGASITSVTETAPVGPAPVPDYRTCYRCHQRI